MKAGHLAVLSLALLAAPPAIAASVRVDYSGIIDEMGGEFGSLTGSFGVGTQFSGYFTFADSATPTYVDLEQLPNPDENFLGYPAHAGYQFPSPAAAFHFEIGDISVDADVPSGVSPMGGYWLDVLDSELNPTPEMGSLVSLDAVVGETPPPTGIDVLLELVQLEFAGGEPGLPLHSTALTAVPWSLVAFPNSRIYLSFTASDGQFPWANGTIDELTVSVPEPASAALAALAALALTGLGLVRARS